MPGNGHADSVAFSLFREDPVTNKCELGGSDDTVHKRVHFPTDQATLTDVHLAVTSLDPTGAGRRRCRTKGGVRRDLLRGWRWLSRALIYLRGRNEPLLDAPSAQYPEVTHLDTQRTFRVYADPAGHSFCLRAC